MELGLIEKELFHFLGRGGWGWIWSKCNNFGVDMSSSVHVDNKKKDILIIRKGPTQGLGEHLLTAEKIYSINFTLARNKFCLNLHYNGANSYLRLLQLHYV